MANKIQMGRCRLARCTGPRRGPSRARSPPRSGVATICRGWQGAREGHRTTCINCAWRPPGDGGAGNFCRPTAPPPQDSGCSGGSSKFARRPATPATLTSWPSSLAKRLSRAATNRSSCCSTKSRGAVRRLERRSSEAYVKLKRKDFRTARRGCSNTSGCAREADLAGAAEFCRGGSACLCGRLVQDFFAAADGDLVRSGRPACVSHSRQAVALCDGDLRRRTLRPPLRKKLYPQVERLQEKLGDINDHASARRHFGEWIASDRAIPKSPKCCGRCGRRNHGAGESTAKFFRVVDDEAERHSAHGLRLAFDLGHRIDRVVGASARQAHRRRPCSPNREPRRTATRMPAAGVIARRCHAAFGYCA